MQAAAKHLIIWNMLRTPVCASLISNKFAGYFTLRLPFSSRNMRMGEEKRVEIEELNDHEEEKNRTSSEVDRFGTDCRYIYIW
jgi:hypothetical protein